MILPIVGSRCVTNGRPVHSRLDVLSPLARHQEPQHESADALDGRPVSCGAPCRSNEASLGTRKSVCFGGMSGATSDATCFLVRRPGRASVNLVFRVISAKEVVDGSRPRTMGRRQWEILAVLVFSQFHT